MASPRFGLTRSSLRPLYATFLFMNSTASVDKSLAIICRTFGISFAYRIERKPDAERASRIVKDWG